MPHSGVRQALVVVTLLALAPLLSPAADVREVPSDFTAIVAESGNAVVGVTTRRVIEEKQSLLDMLPEPFRERFREQDPNGTPRPDRALGSGFLIDEAGHIVTNAHVIQAATEIEVRLADGRSVTAELVGADPETDLAVLRIEPQDGMAVAHWGDSELMEPGAWTIAMGSPFGLGGTVTVGVLSAHSRDIRAGPYDDYLQTDASINMGNSGGPLFNVKGEVIGVNTAIFSPVGINIGIGFAVPSATAERIVEQLIEKGEIRRGFLGINLQEVNDPLARAFGLAEPQGALVAETMPGGPADEAGIRHGDIVLQLNGEAVEDPRDLSFVIAEREPGSTVTITIRRNGEDRDVEITLGTREMEVAEAPEPQELPEDPPLGLGLTTLPTPIQQELRLETGVGIQHVEPLGLAAQAGLAEGDIILEVDNQLVEHPIEVADAWEAAKAEDRPLLMRIMRDQMIRYVAIES